MRATAQMLRDVPLFATLTLSDLDVLLEGARTIQLSAGEPLFARHDIGDAAFVVQRGAIDVTTPGQGEEISIATLGAGQVIGELALVDGAVRSASARAATDAVVLRFERELFDVLRRADSPIAGKLLRQIARTISARLRATSARITELTDANLELPPIGVQGTPAPQLPGRRVSELLDRAIDAAAVFEDLDDAERALIARHVRLCAGVRDEVVFREGEIADRCFIQIVGTTSVDRQMPWGALERVAELGPGALVGHVALIDNQPRSATCRVSSSRAVYLQIDRHDFEVLFEAQAPFAYKCLYRAVVDLALRLRHATARVHALERVHSAEARRFKLLEIAEVMESVNQPALSVQGDREAWSAEGLVLTRARWR